MARRVPSMSAVTSAPAAALQLQELPEAGLEDALHAGRDVAPAGRALVQAVQVGAAPELALEGLRLASARGAARTS